MNPRPQILDFKRPNRLFLAVSAAIITSILVIILLALLHFRQQQTIREMAATINTIHLAQVDLSKGFLAFTLSNNPGSSYNREEGIALLQQAIESFRKTEVILETSSDQSTIANFNKNLAIFQEMLMAYRAKFSLTPEEETNLRIAFHALEQSANAIDGVNQNRLDLLSSELDRQFYIYLFIAAALLAGLCSTVIYAGRAKAKVDTSLGMYAEIMTVLAEGVVIVQSHSQEIIYTNRKFDDMFGYEPNELIGKKIAIINAAGDISPEQAAQNIENTMLNEGKWEGEILNVRKNGETFWCSAKVSAYKLPDFGEVWVTIQEEITEQKKMLLALHEKLRLQEQLEMTASVVPGMIHAFKQDSQGKFSMPYASPAIESMYKLSPADVQADASPIFARIDELDVPHVVAKISESAQSMTTWRDEFRFNHPDKGLRWYAGHSSPVSEPDGSIIWYGIIEDVTEQKAAQTEIFHRQQLLEKVIRLGKNITAIVDLDRCLREIYDCIRQDLGFDRVGLYLYDTGTRTVMGVHGTNRLGEYEDLSGRNRPVEFWPEWLKALDSLNGYHYEEDYAKTHEIPAAHSMYGVHQHIILAAWAGETPVALISADNLVSGRPIMPAEIETLQLFAGYAGLAVANARLNSELEERIRARTAELQISRDRLSAANIALEKAARMKDEFMASMSHELRTPLTGILGLSEALQLATYGSLSEKQSKALSLIEKSGQHLLALINDILDLSKVEAGMLELNMDLVSLHDICRAALQMIRSMAAKKNHQVSFSMIPALIIVRGDDRRLKQMLVNLLSNAIKFTPSEQSIGLEVRGIETENLVRITVWDTGIGIAEENLPKLFQPFVQLDSQLSRQYEGSGLGLSLVQRMAELHGGSVEVESSLGKGSRFTIILPWHPQDSNEILPAGTGNAASVATGEQTAEIKGQKILIADDNDTLLDTLADYLDFHGFSVSTTHSGIELLEIAPALRPHLVIMDIQMPVMDGIEAIQRLRAHPDKQLAETPVIALTALAMTGDRERCLQAGANEYLSKPVTLTALLELIRGLLANHAIREIRIDH